MAELPTIGDGSLTLPLRPAPASDDNGHAQPPIIIIAPHGDLVVSISHETASSKATHKFRVNSSDLTSHSRYFAGLLDGRFEEGRHIKRTNEALRERFGSIDKAPNEQLPVVTIEDVGRISTVRSIEPLCKDFLSIIHGLELQTTPPVANLANLATVADRFDALEAVCVWTRRKKVIGAIDAKTTMKIDNALTEEKVRQRLLVAQLLDYGPWLEKYSSRIIVNGWTGHRANASDTLWWDLPSRLEEELAFRRECVLDTVQSIQDHLMKLLLSRERLCRLGYDSSAQCDIFQLGQSIKFLSRIGTIQLQGTILETEPPPSFTGDVFNLIDTLRQCPEYQIDSNHSHCGIRTKLIPLLDLITECLNHVGICKDCWAENRIDHAWMEAKRPLTWKRALFRLRSTSHGELHANVRAMFMASERDWSP